MSSTRANSTPPARTFRHSSQPNSLHLDRPKTASKIPDFLSRSHRASVQPNARIEKGKDIARGKTSVDSTDTASSAGQGDLDSFAGHYNASSSFTSNEQSPSPSRESPPLKPDDAQSNSNSSGFRKRASLLVAASDALNLKFGRRRKSVVRQPQMPIILPDVIEISAPRRDEELEERERLRDAAVQSIGLAPVLIPESQPEKDMVGAEEEEEHTTEGHEHDRLPSLEQSNPASSTPSVTLSPKTVNDRPRQRSWIAPLPSSFASVTARTIPAFPTTISTLTTFTQLSSSIPKFYPPTSLRIFSLSRNWKNRFIILTSPAPIPRASVGPTTSHLHLFKSSGQGEEELERLEINEESVVFVAEEDAGGRRNVVKVGGDDVGAVNKVLNPQSGGRTMWFLQITNSAEAQKWIAAIKNAIFAQRSMRAGLGLPSHTLGSIEPRGDMDVMLSMQAQGIISSPVSDKFVLPETNRGYRPSGSSVPALDNYAASVSSHSVRSQSTVPKTFSTGTVSALKGLFNNRPRSASRAASLDHPFQDRDAPDDPLVNRGNTLLSLLRSTSIPDGGSSSSPPVPPLPTVFAPSDNYTALRSPIDRNILEEPHVEGWSSPKSDVEPSNDRLYKTQSVSQPIPIPSLQPPPRKRWTYTHAPPPLSTDTGMYQHTNGNASMANSFGIASEIFNNRQPRPVSPASTAQSPGSPEQSNRAPSLYSVSTYASAENSVPDRSLKRWSKQGNIPQMLAPPNGPPPSTPPATPHSFQLQTQPHSPTDSHSRSSSIFSATGTKGILPTFSKRTSDSSRISDSTASTSHSPVTGSPHTSSNSHRASIFSSSRPSSTHRVSLPPAQRPAPSFAPPPPPVDQYASSSSRPDSPPAGKSTFRDSVVHPHRVLRLSLVGPKPPPSTSLPPRPDEHFQEYGPSHGKMNGSNTNLSSIPGTPRSATPPFPPPNGPLPQPPSSSSPSTSRRTSLKQRLRILSAPSPMSTTSTVSQPSALRLHPLTQTNTPSPPVTPIGVKITNTQPDPSFLLVYSPSTPTASITPTPSTVTAPLRRQDPDPDRPPPPESHSSTPEIASLSPPPRRGSRVMSFPVTESSDETPSLDERPSLLSAGDGQPLSLSPQTSAVSLGIAV